MPFELYLNDNSVHNFDKLHDIPKEFDNNVLSLEALEMNIKNKDINNIGLRFPNIEQLNVSCNKLKTLDLSYFHNLKIIRAARNKISEIIGFEYCHKLREVVLVSNYLENIASNHNVKELLISNNKLSTVPNFNNLEVLDVRLNKKLETIGDYPKLTHLCIANTLISKINLYMNLVILDCSYTPIEGIPPFPKLETLEFTYMYNNKNLPYLPYLPSLKEMINGKNIVKIDSNKN